MDIALDDPAVSLRISGRWRGTLQGGWGLALTPLGTTLISDESPFFTQESDLTLSLWIRERWFVEVGVVDNSALNTYRAGYQGLEGELIRYIGVGNVGLDFPSFPFLDLGGDSPSSFGLYGHFGRGALGLHLLLRYDAAAREERVFVGGRERNFSFADLSRPQRGISFVLPDEHLDSIPVVFIQDNRGGNLTDTQGRRWRLANRSEFGASARHGIVEFTLAGGAAEPEGMIAVAYSLHGDNQPWNRPEGMGSYDTPGTFLGDVQAFFGNVALREFPQAGQPASALMGTSANIPGTLVINGLPALVVFEPGTFSPFERQNRYLAPVSGSGQAAVVSRSAGVVDPRFELVPLDDISPEAFFLEPEQRVIRRGVYELIRAGARNTRLPRERWPLGDLYPELYLPGRLAFTADLGLRFSSYFGTAGAFFIGTDVVPGSVQVFRSGIQDPNFVFSPSTGIVTLRNPAGFSEVIRITYLRQSSERRLGSLAAGIGAIWEPEGAFSGRVGLGLRWNVASDAYSQAGATSPGTIGLGAEARWDYEQFRAGLALGLGFHQPDATGLYRVTGMEGNELTLPLPPRASFISPAPMYLDGAPFSGQRARLIYRNFQEHSLLFGSSLGDISSSAPVVPGESGPFPAQDRAFSSNVQVLVAEFDFEDGDTWTGFQTPLGASGEFLERAGRIDIPFRFMNFPAAPPADFSVVLQIGALSPRDTGNPENPNLILERRLYPPETAGDRFNPVAFDESARIASFVLEDRERAKLQGASYLRLIVRRQSAGGGDIQGRVILAPPVVWGSFWRPITAQGSEISAARTAGTSHIVRVFEEIDFSLERTYRNIISRLNSSSRNRVLAISWEDFAAAAGPGADGRIPAVPLSHYRSLSFFVRRPQAEDAARQQELDEATLRFILAQGPSSLERPNEIALEASIPLAAFGGVEVGEWVRVDIQYRGTPRVLVGGNAAPGASAVFRNGAAGFSGSGQDEAHAAYAAFFLVPGNHDIPAGNMAVDEIILEEPIPSYRLNTGASVEWARQGTLIGIGERAILSDLSFQAAVESAAEGNPFEDESSGSFGMSGRTLAAFSLLGFRITGNYSYALHTSSATTIPGSSQTAGHTWAAGHSVSRFFGPLYMYDAFDNSPDDRTMTHRLGLALHTRIRGNINAQAVYDNQRLRRRWQAGSGGRLAREFPLYVFLDTHAGINERVSGLALAHYGETWLNSFEFFVPDSGAGAESRDMGGSFRKRLGTSPLGMELYFRGAAAYSQLSQAARSSSLARLDIPVSPAERNFRLLFRGEREYRRELSGESFDFRHDGEIWADSFTAAVPVLFSLPFYSLFASGMTERMSDFAFSEITCGFEPASSFFADRFDFSLMGSGNYGLSSLFLPNRFSFRLSRILEQRLDTPRDTLNVGTLMGFSSVNLFGAMGAVPFFDFYMGDEFSHSIEATISFPKGEEASWSIRANQNMFFFGFSGAELSLANALTINSPARSGEGIRLKDILTVAWTVPRQNTLLGTLYSAFARMARERDFHAGSLAAYEYQLLTRHTLEFVFERIPDAFDGDYNRFSFIVGHESIVRIFGRLHLSAFANLAVARNDNTRVISFLGTVGTMLTLMF